MMQKRLNEERRQTKPGRKWVRGQRRVISCAQSLLVITLLAVGCREEAPVSSSTSPSGSSSVEQRGDSGAAREERAQHGTPWFERVADAGGIDFHHVSGHDGETFYAPESLAGGVALVDLTGDGHLDAYLVQSGDVRTAPSVAGRNRLYLNIGRGRFRDGTSNSGADDPGYGMGVAAGDYDNDGMIDLYVTNVGANALLRNLGDGRFEDVTAATGTGDEGWGCSATFVDYDRDGFLDLFVTNYVRWSVETEIRCINMLGLPDYCLPLSYNAPATDVLYRNIAGERFENVTESSGIASRAGTGLGVVAADFTGDGYPDIFVANDKMLDNFWVNQQDGTFRDQALVTGVAVNMSGEATASMGVAVADLEGTGHLDLIICNFRGESDTLFRNTGRGFMDTAAVAGLGTVSRMFTRFGMAFMDFDHDGLFDLYIGSGRVVRESESFDPNDAYAEPNVLYRGTAPMRFEEVRPRGGTSDLLLGTSRGVAFGDVDGDGAIDMLVVNRDGPAHLLRNIAPKQGNWIMLRVLDEHGRDALNARVTVRAGERTRVYEVLSGYSYCSANDPRVHVGLGAAEHARDIKVRWLDGSVEVFGDRPAGAVHVLERGVGAIDPSSDR